MSDAEAAVAVRRGLAVQHDRHGRGGLGAPGRRDVEALDAPGRSGQPQGLPEFRQGFGAALRAQGGAARGLRRVPRREFPQAAALGARAQQEAHPAAAPLSQEGLQRETVVGHERDDDLGGDVAPGEVELHDKAAQSLGQRQRGP